MKLVQFLKNLFRKKTTDIKFDRIEYSGKYRLENQNICMHEFGQCDILDFIQQIVDDEDQFITLELPKASCGVRYVQACVNRGKIEVQLGIEESDHIRLVSKNCSLEECQNIFIRFFETGEVERAAEYKPVRFYI